MGGLTIHRDQIPPTGIVADRRLYLTGDGKLAEHGAPDASILLAAGPGDVIPAARAKELDLSVADGKVMQGSASAAPASDPAPEPEPEKDLETEKPKSRRGR